MDLSKEYIAMCNVPEIQDNYSIPKAGDFISVGEIGIEIVLDYEVRDFTIDDERQGLVVICDTEGLIEYRKGSFIWLPRQDQLQEMIGGDQVRYFYTDYSYDTMPNHWELYREPYENEQKRYDGQSIEQCFLKVIMAEKFNKIWKNGEWL